MRPEQLLTITQEKGIILKAQGSQLAFKAPRGSMTPELVESLKRHKPEIIKILNETQTATENLIPLCLGVACNDAEYKELDGMPYCLWCNRINEPVIDMQECPEKYWAKDKKGIPVSSRGRRVLLAYHIRH